MPIISLHDVSFAYTRNAYVLKQINLAFEEGEFTAIIGNNGSGKSTLMKLILGLLKPSHGEVLIDGLQTSRARVSALAQKIGFVFQNPHDQLFCNTVAEEIAYGLKNLHLPPDEIEERVNSALTRFDLQNVRETFPRFLAHGDQQKVCLASTVVMRPRILLLDEPTTGQDHRDSRQILELVQQLNREGITILLVTHDMINVAQYAKRVLVLNNSQLLRDAPTAEVLSDFELLEKCHLTPPQVVRLSMQLQQYGFPLALSVDDLVASTRAWLAQKKAV